MSRKIIALLMSFIFIIGALPVITVSADPEEIYITENWGRDTAAKNVKVYNNSDVLLNEPRVSWWFSNNPDNDWTAIWPPFYAVADFEGKYVLTKYELNGGGGSAAAHSYEFYGSNTNNGIDWVKIAEKGGNVANVVGDAFDTNTGYRFLKFRITNCNGDNEWLCMGKVKIFGYASAAACTVTFNSNGGSTVAPIQTAENQAITVPTPPTKDESIFLGWYKDAGLKQKWNFDDAVLGDMTLYAKWTDAIFTVSFDSKGGTKIASYEDYKDELIERPRDPGRKGYLFDGWYKDDEYNSIWDFDNDVLTANLTLYAKWIYSGFKVPLTSDSIISTDGIGNFFGGWKDSLFDGITWIGKGTGIDENYNNYFRFESSPATIVIDLGEEKKLTYYRIYGHPGVQLVDYKIQGSNSAEGPWETLSAVTENTDAIVQGAFGAEVDSSYRYIRLSVTRFEDWEWFKLYEIEFYSNIDSTIIDIAPDPEPIERIGYRRGVNFACADSGNLPGIPGTDYAYSIESGYEYFTRNGMDLFRIPFLWERIQPTLRGPLGDYDLTGLKNSSAWAKKYGGQIILDLHNYNSYRFADDGYANHNPVGSARVGADDLIDVWSLQENTTFLSTTS